MLPTIKKLFYRHKEIILYVFFGGLTTLCNVLAYLLLVYPLKINELVATAIAWLISVVFAYLTNRKWVFESRETGVKAIMVEAIRFLSARLFSGGVDLAIMAIFVTVCGFNDVLIKLISNIMVIVLNFILSKIFVFGSKTKRRDKE